MLLYHSDISQGPNYSSLQLVLLKYPAFPFIFFAALILLGNRTGQYVWEDHRPRSGVWKGTSGGEVISFSGCDDDQTSADTSVSF